MVSYVLGGMIAVVVGYGLYTILFGSKEEHWRGAAQLSLAAMIVLVSRQQGGLSSG